MVIFLDPQVTGDQKNVMGIICGHMLRNTNRAMIGSRRIAELSRLSQATVSRRIAELEGMGYLKRQESKRGYREAYLVQGLVCEPRPKVEPLGSALRCSGCEQERHWISKAGICRRCIGKIELEKACKVAIAELGPDATIAEIAARIKNAATAKKITPVVRKILRDRTA